MILSEQQSRLYGCFSVVDEDVQISTLYDTLNVTTRGEVNDRMRQQVVGSAVSRINRKICHTGYSIVPGDMKRTYRLTLIK